MHGRPIDQLVYEQLFPRPKSGDPLSFRDFLNENLVQEVRHEVMSYYGHVQTAEAKYPGLDYTNRIHRIRLGRWPWHRRLFRAFDALGLTPHEIHSLTKWEGTKWAKERYEKEEGVTIRDTASDEFPDWIEPSERTEASTPERIAEDGDAEMEIEEESDDEVAQSVGVELNERLRDRVARRNAGDTSTVLDEEWEQWFKHAIETGALQGFSPISGRNSDALPQGMMTAARAGNWHNVPEALRNFIRRSHETEQMRERRTITAQTAPISSLRTTQSRNSHVFGFRPSRSSFGIITASLSSEPGSSARSQSNR